MMLLILLFALLDRVILFLAKKFKANQLSILILSWFTPLLFLDLYVFSESEFYQKVLLASAIFIKIVADMAKYNNFKDMIGQVLAGTLAFTWLLSLFTPIYPLIYTMFYPTYSQFFSF